MGRMTVGIIVGYVATLLLTFAGLCLAYVVLGTDAAFQPESFKPSGSWIWVMFLVGFAAAAIGAVIAGRVAPGTKAPLALADVVLVLGFFFSVVGMIVGGSEGVRTADLSVMEAMTQTRQPVWAALINPIVQKVGVYLGAWLTLRN